jgi:hypothetical protein
LLKQNAIFGIEGFEGTETLNQDIHELSYDYFNFKTINPYQYRVALEQQSYQKFGGEDASYLKLTADLKTTWTITKTKSMDVRLFGSYFIANTERESSSFSNDFNRGSIAMMYQGFNDYKYDEYFINRAQQGRSLSDQTSGSYGGGFKTALGSQYGVGQSNDYAFAINVMTDLPFKFPKILPIRVFADLGYYSTKSFSSEPLEGQLLYSAGLTLDWKILQIHLPLINSDLIGDVYTAEDQNIFQRISFRFNINDFNPWDLQDDFNF